MEFSWDAMAGNLQDNAFSEKKRYGNEVDTRFWKLSRDENENGGAVVRFLPDPNNVPFVTLTRINAQKQQKGGFFVSEWSPTTIGLKCPFNEKFSELWKKGEKETAKQLGRAQRYITNIKVIKDPANPDNEGKIFLYDMSQTMIEMLKGAMIQTEAMKALDEEPIAAYNPLQGNNFLIKAKLGTNKIITYNDSKFSDKVNGIYTSAEEATADITENAYELKEFLDPANFKSYDELQDLLHRFLNIGKYGDDAETEAAVAAVETNIDTGLNMSAPQNEPTNKPDTKPVEIPNQDDELDALLNELD